MSNVIPFNGATAKNHTGPTRNRMPARPAGRTLHICPQPGYEKAAAFQWKIKDGMFGYGPEDMTEDQSGLSFAVVIEEVVAQPLKRSKQGQLTEAHLSVHYSIDGADVDVVPVRAGIETDGICVNLEAVGDPTHEFALLLSAHGEWLTEIAESYAAETAND